MAERSARKARIRASGINRIEVSIFPYPLAKIIALAVIRAVRVNMYIWSK
jgi:hypothetical protein